MNFPFSNNFNFKAWSEERLAQVEQVLKQGIDAHAPAGLGEAMRYAVLDGGKRLRPLLVLAAAEAVGVDLEAATVSRPVIADSDVRSDFAWFHSPFTRNTMAPKLVMGCVHCLVIWPCCPQFVQYTLDFMLYGDIRWLLDGRGRSYLTPLNGHRK